VRSEAKSAREAQRNANQTIQRILEQLRESGVKDDRIQTSQLSLQPVYGDPRSRSEADEPRIVGYSASYTLSVQTEELSQISAIIDQSLEAGANQLRGIRFELRDQQKAREEALRAAVADARRKAKVVAEASGVKLVRILAVVEGGAVVRPSMMARTARMSAEVGGTPTPVMPGQVTVTGQVTMRYQIRED
jgi:uncharacterized protein YggE